MEAYGAIFSHISFSFHRRLHSTSEIGSIRVIRKITWHKLLTHELFYSHKIFKKSISVMQLTMQILVTHVEKIVHVDQLHGIAAMLAKIYLVVYAVCVASAITIQMAVVAPMDVHVAIADHVIVDLVTVDLVTVAIVLFDLNESSFSSIVLGFSNH